MVGEKEPTKMARDTTVLQPAARTTLLEIIATQGSGLSAPAPDWPSWVDGQLKQLPEWYLVSTPAEQMAVHLLAIRNVSANPTYVEGRFNAELGVSEYVLITRTQAKPGLMMQVTGVFSALGLEVLNAQIMTLADGTVLDLFSVNDSDCDGSPSEYRFDEVSQEIQAVVQEQCSVDQVLERRRRMTFGRPFPTGRHPTEVLIENEVSDSYTVIDVFADDKPGLLFVLAKALVQLNLSIHMARIGTRLDQVVDVFYVTTTSGEKIQDVTHCEQMQEAIQKAVNTFLDEGQ
jgi:[protein-PII] uridylyltransferase